MEQHLIRHCAPTLAGIKAGSLFYYAFSSKAALEAVLLDVNQTLNPKGVFVQVLCLQRGGALVFVYRGSGVRGALAKPGVAEFLRGRGYCGTSLREHLDQLKSRLSAQEKFPHEIGLFLGYPLQDVIGFIENAGQNSRYTGCWKVYCNERESIKLFERFHKCKEIYTRLFLQGRPFERLIVAA